MYSIPKRKLLPTYIESKGRIQREFTYSRIIGIVLRTSILIEANNKKWVSFRMFIQKQYYEKSIWH